MYSVCVCVCVCFPASSSVVIKSIQSVYLLISKLVCIIMSELFKHVNLPARPRNRFLFELLGVFLHS